LQLEVPEMPRAKQLFTERDLARAFRAALRAGVQIDRVVIDKASGNIEVFAAQPAACPTHPKRKTEPRRRADARQIDLEEAIAAKGRVA
jgi:hypothetical protein